MTLPQIKGFLAAIGKQTAIDNAVFLSNTALGSQGAGKDIKKIIQSYIKSVPKKSISENPTEKQSNTSEG